MEINFLGRWLVELLFIKENFMASCIKNNKYYFILAFFLLIFSFFISYNMIFSITSLLIVLVIGIAFKLPDKIFLFAVLLFASPIDNISQTLGGFVTVVFLHKALILIGVLIYMFSHGIKKKISYMPIWSTFLIFIFSLTLSTNVQGYKISDLVTATFGYILGWIFFYVNWDDAIKYLYVIAILPIISVILGIVLNVVHVWDFFQNIDSIRLQGASIPPHLAMLGLVGMVSALTLYYIGDLKKQKLYMFIVLIDFIIIMGTITRGAIIGTIIIMILVVGDYIKKSHAKNANLTFEILIIVIALSVVLVVFGALILFRSEGSGGTLNTSGRTDAWTYYLNIGSANRLFGVGFGAIKTITGVDINNSFTAAHNEYLRFFVESGIVGLSLTIISFIKIFRAILKQNIIEYPKFLIPAFMLAFLIFAFTDNTISAVEFWVLFCWYMGLVYDNKHLYNEELFI